MMRYLGNAFNFILIRNSDQKSMLNSNTIDENKKNRRYSSHNIFNFPFFFLSYFIAMALNWIRDVTKEKIKSLFLNFYKFSPEEIKK